MGFISILSLLSLLLVMMAAGTNGRWPYRKDYTYEPNVKGWVKLHMVPRTWAVARLRCFVEGSTLMSPLNVELLDVMKTNIYDHNVSELFTGISTYTTGDFYSIGGISFESMRIPKKWAPGEPNIDGKENCITLNRAGLLADVKCSKVLPYMCFKMNIDSDSVSSKQCGTVDPNYIFYKKTGQCYKVHPTGRSWSKAFMTCAIEGAFLAVINSDEEAEVLKDLMKKYPRIHSKYDNLFAVGYHDWNQYGGMWITVHGRTLEEAGYNKWAKGEPNNNNKHTGEHCGAIYRDALFNDIGCEENLAFICEKRPGTLQDKEYDSSNEV